MTAAGRRTSTFCRAGPVRGLHAGEFDVAGRPKSSTRFDREMGCRIIPESGLPVCVHPDRIGLSPGAYASAGTPLPGAAAVLAENPAGRDDRFKAPTTLTHRSGARRRAQPQLG